MKQFIPYHTIGSYPALVAAAGDRAQERFIEFFTAIFATATPAAPTRTR
jgi:hypothetical protein